MRPIHACRSSAVLLLLLGACGAPEKGTAVLDPSVVAVAPSSAAVAPARPARLAYPATPRGTVVDELHGTRIADPYRWLEDGSAPEVRSWMAAEDALARGELARLPRRDAIAERLKQVLYYDSNGAPVHRGERWFFARKHADREKAIVYATRRLDGGATTLLDPNGWSTDGSAGLGGWWPSRDGRFVAYARKENNSDESVMHVVDVERVEDLPDVLPGTKYGAASWTPDGAGFYYTWVPPLGTVEVADRPGRTELRYHALGTDPAQDPVVHPATGDPRTFLAGSVSWDGRWLFAWIQHGWNSTDMFFQDLREPGERAWRPLAVGLAGNFDVIAWHDAFYVLTDLDAPRRCVLRIEPSAPAREHWRVLVPEREATLENVELVGERLLLTYLDHAAHVLEIHALDGALERTVALPPLGTVAGVTGNPDDDAAYFTFSSFLEASAVESLSMSSGALAEWSRVRLPIDTSRMVAEQVRYPSRDGTEITMFLLHRSDARKDGRNPALLYGYGGFASSLTPAFSASRVVWLELGGILALPNLRGGGEYGEAWHQAGMGARKQNVFDDYLAAARFLVDQRWTSPERLALQGGSNGGLLVGAAMTQAPELFRAVVCGVPLLDMLRYHRFGSGMTWIPEYGSADDPEQFKTLYAYSPYQHVIDGTPYPALLLLSADSDDRVDPMHARKFAARVQQASSSGRPVLLRIEQHAGHGGADLVRQQVEATADTYAFLVRELGM